MVNAGPATDAVIDEFAPLLEPGDMAIDGSNAHFKDTRRREANLKDSKLHFVGMGVSGGEEGALNGPSIMPARRIRTGLPGPRSHARDHRGSGRRYAVLHARRPEWSRPLREMVHNGIEYADIKLIAEAYDLLRNAAGRPAAADR